MVNWWFGLVWIPGIPLWKGFLLRGAQKKQTNHRASNHYLLKSYTIEIISLASYHCFFHVSYWSQEQRNQQLGPSLNYHPQKGASKLCFSMHSVIQSLWAILDEYSILVGGFPDKTCTVLSFKTFFGAIKMHPFSGFHHFNSSLYGDPA